MNIICVARFIPTATSTGIPGFVYFQGDNRDFSSDSPKDASRFWLWINADSGEIIGSPYAHPTQRVSGPNGKTVGNPSPSRSTANSNPLIEMALGSNYFSTSKDSDGSITLSYHVVCSDPICNNLLAPNGSVTFTPNGQGSYDANGLVDTFPNIEAYHWNGSKLQNDYLFRTQNFSADERATGHASAMTSFGMAHPIGFSARSHAAEGTRMTFFLNVDGRTVSLEE